MKHKLFLFLVFTFFVSNSQTINLNESHIIDYLRINQLIGKVDSNFSFTQRPINIGKMGININDSIIDLNKYSPVILNFANKKGKLKILPIDYNIEYSSHHPYNRNNGSMIPNRGYQ